MKVHARATVVPSRILGLLRLLAATTSIEKEDAARLMQPEPLLRDSRSRGADSDEAPGPDKKPTLAKEAIATAMDMGLIDAATDGRGRDVLTLSADHAASAMTLKDQDYHWRTLSGAALKAVDDADGGNPFAVFCAWLQFIPSSAVPPNLTALKTELMSDGFDLDDLSLRSDAPLQTALYWSHYLGLTWHRGKDNVAGGKANVADGLVPDPSLYLERMLHVLVSPEEGDVSILEFRARVGRLCPVLDGGVVHAVVARHLLDRGRPRAISDDRLTPGFSFALRYLRSAGLLEYHTPSDQRQFLLLGPDEKIAFVRAPRS